MALFYPYPESTPDKNAAIEGGCASDSSRKIYLNSVEVIQNRQKVKLLWWVLGLRSGLFLVELTVGLQSHSLYLLHKDSHDDLNLRSVFLHGVADVASSVGVMLAALAVYFLNWLWADAAIRLT